MLPDHSQRKSKAAKKWEGLPPTYFCTNVSRPRYVYSTRLVGYNTVSQKNLDFHRLILFDQVFGSKDYLVFPTWRLAQVVDGSTIHLFLHTSAMVTRLDL